MASLPTANATAAYAGTEAIVGTAPVELVVYSLGARALAEFIGMTFVIYTGEAALANELLPSTKGHGMGWGWAVFTFGFAFLPPLMAFQLVSAKLNPAMCLAQAIWGNITWVDFVVLSAAEFAGAFFGALLHFLHFFPHWRTLPEPPAENDTDALLRRRDVATDDALRFAGYNTRRDRVVRARNPLSDLRYRLTGVGRWSGDHEATARELLSDYYETRDPVHHSASVTGNVTPVPRGDRPLARRTLQVADLQRHLAAKHVEAAIRQRTCPSCTASPGGQSSGADDAGGQRDSGSAGDNGVTIAMEGGEPPAKVAFLAEEQRRAQALYQAALRADQNCKLSIFATRPAINAPLFNLLTEAMGTCALILIALLIELQARHLPAATLRPLYVVGLQPLLITFSIVMLIAGLGGPTTYAANPARDLGPRFAHFILPIPNKGRSEWVYAWVPALGPMIGGAVAGGLYIAIEELIFPGGGPKG